MLNLESEKLGPQGLLAKKWKIGIGVNMTEIGEPDRVVRREREGDPAKAPGIPTPELVPAQ